MTKKKRARQAAGVETLPDGGYKILATYKPPGQKQMRRKATLPPGSTLAQALLLREQLVAQMQGVIAPPAASPQLATYTRSWLAHKAALLKPKTAETYAASLAPLVADLGHLQIDQLARHHVSWWRDQLQAEVGPLSIATVQRRWRYGVAVIRDALAEHELRDVTSRIRPPVGKTSPRRETRTLSRAQLDRLAEATGGKYGSLCRFLIRTGCRFGEAAGLRWCDLDMEGRTARLRQSASEITGGFQIAALKADEGRVVGLSEDMVLALAQHRAAYPGVAGAMVWATKTGQPAKKIYCYRALDAASARAQIPVHVRPQVLRRSIVSLGLEMGLDRLLLQKIIGHADDEMTRLYHGLRPETAAALAVQIWG